ncbi:sporulation histidine kinase inhibitor Sda [Paenibacillus sp. NPDC056579]|uniref:sporulation histidine kinase inhibitor Sda n=1 Tax=unclassified Paenibacillus TaxID=185978 RepID=UPI001EF8D1C4|nr:sporulation histidine kinase inhibitor Sda [Paenibacillus sp. H1-7]ULL13931.1 sporulation histidine kinase inhibitor Sda [Paenibacillus sp. H1-7]
MYNSLGDKELIYCYAEAVRMELDPDFIRLLITEIEKRQLHGVVGADKLCQPSRVQVPNYWME